MSNQLFQFSLCDGRVVSQSFSILPVNFPTVSSSYLVNGDLITSNVSPATLDLLSNVYSVHTTIKAGSNWYISSSNNTTTASTAIVSGSYSTGSLCSVVFNNLNNNRMLDANKLITIKPLASRIGFNASFICADTVDYLTDATGSLTVTLVRGPYSITYNGGYRTETYTILVPASASVNVKDCIVTSTNVAKEITPKNQANYGYTAQSSDARYYLSGSTVLSSSYAATASLLLGSVQSAISSSYAQTASFALNGGGGGTSLTTGSTYPITASVSVNSISSSYVKGSGSILAKATIDECLFYGDNQGNLTIGTALSGRPPIGGGNNTALGQDTLMSLTNGSENVALGEFALHTFNDGDSNIAIGENVLANLTSGDRNTSIGGLSLSQIDTCTDNIALGYLAGSVLASGDNNIFVGNVGANVSNTIFLGNETHTKTFISGQISASIITASLHGNADTSTFSTTASFATTASKAISSSYSVTSSFASTSPATTLVTASTYQVTSSWSNNATKAISSSYFSGSNSVALTSSVNVVHGLINAVGSDNILVKTDNGQITLQAVENGGGGGVDIIVDNEFSITSLGDGSQILMPGDDVITIDPSIGGFVIISGSLIATGSLNGTSSWSNNTISSSYALTSSFAQTASYITSSKVVGSVATASFASVATSASFATTAGAINFVPSVAVSASFASASISSSWSNLSQLITPVTWSALTAGATVTWSVAQNVYQDKKTLIVTGPTTMSVQNLYSGFEGSLKITNGNTGSLLKISPTIKTLNGGTGSIGLTNTSASVDYVALQFDGTTLYAAFGNNFN